MKGKHTNPLASRIKRVMQADEDVGKIAQATPVLIGHSVELFLGQLCKGAAAIASTRGDKTLGTAHLKAFVSQEAGLDFLKSIVEKAPELVDKPTSPAKRQRAGAKSEDSSGGGRGRGRGRGKAKAEREPGEPSPRKRAKTPKSEQKEEVGDEAVAAPADVTILGGASSPEAPQTVASHLHSGSEMKVELGNGGEAATLVPRHQTPEADAASPEGALPPKTQPESGEEQRQLKPEASARASPAALNPSAPAFAAGLEDEDDYDADD